MVGMQRGDWNEANLSEHPAVLLLRRLGYTYVRPEDIAAERGSNRESVLAGRLRAALRRLNPWLSEDNLHKAVQAVANQQAASLIEASLKVHTYLTCTFSVDQDLGEGKKGQDVRYFDFDHPERNELVVTRQFEVRGAKTSIIPDIVVFVNGVPLCIIECKSPTLGDKWRHEALDQFDRYQELSPDYRDRGAPRLFHTVQLLIATCGQAACYGTVTTPKRHFAEWKIPHPDTPETLRKALGREATPQDVLLWGMLKPENLFDLVRNFVVFEKDRGSGRLLRKVCRYQQFAAVNKALERAARQTGAGRGGVVWHTQGSGKSLTMLWLAVKLRRDPAHQNPTILIVTDRRDLDQQITQTFASCGFPNPTQAQSVKDLRALLSGPGGGTILTTVQKFMDGTAPGGGKGAPVGALSAAANLFVLTDEAHRTQYGVLAANMRAALPNACFIGFTGTPIDKDDRSTLATFGPYIDQYTIQQAVADGATVPIFYESRLPELRIIGNSLDALFERVFADRTKKEREQIKRRYATEQTLAGAPRRIELICLDLIEHFATHIQPDGFKAQIVACSREVAVLYQETLERLNGPPSRVIMSGTNKDPQRLAAHHTTAAERQGLIERFCKPDDPLAILIVCDMLITGFDAPIEQVMYLDAPLRDHTLLQAIARVNRTAEKKTYGLVVDYWGVSEDLQDALSIFSQADVQGALPPKTDELPRLAARHAQALRFFARVKDRGDLNACVAALSAEDVRADFDLAFRRLAQSMDLLLPDTRALPYVADLRWLGKVRLAAAARYRDPGVDISDCGAKVRRLIEDAVVAEGIQVLVARVALFSQDFERRLRELKTPEAQASEMEHAIRDEITVKLDEDPAHYGSLQARLMQIIADDKARRIDAARKLELLEALRRDLGGPARGAQALGLSETAYAIFGLLRGGGDTAAAEARPGYGAAAGTAELASLIEEALAGQLEIVDWHGKDSVQKEMRRLIKRHLRAASYPVERHEELAEAIVALLKVRRGR